jgi:hypothetical protein
VDLQGVTEKPTHMLSSKYNMITRLQNPPADGINYIQVFRRQIGRWHALIEYRDFSFWVIDQNSVNGTFLNGERLARETRLKHGDRHDMAGPAAVWMARAAQPLLRPDTLLAPIPLHWLRLFPVPRGRFARSVALLLGLRATFRLRHRP